MTSNVSVRLMGSVSVLELSGHITLEDGCGAIRDAVQNLIAKGERNVLVNLSEVNHIDSAGLGELVSSYAAVRNHHGQLKLLDVGGKVHDLLQMTKLYTVFEVFADEAAAVESFRQHVVA